MLLALGCLGSKKSTIYVFERISLHAFVSPVISLIKNLISVITLIRSIKFRANADIWIAEDTDYIAELVTLPGIVPNRRNGRERWNIMYHLHDPDRRT